jgi:hypothetical protein
VKKKILLTIFSLIAFFSHSQNIQGAWESYSTSENGDKLRHVAVFTNGFNVVTTYNATDGKFVSTKGGSWTLNGNSLTETIEFDTVNSESVGTEIDANITISANDIIFTDSGKTFKRIDNGTPGLLQGAWLMSGRVRDGQTESRDTSRPRKTMKILSGSRFQWIAYNTETKQFMGTGGGTYTTDNGEYTENIEFFSRDASRVGASLKFNYKLVDGHWHHSGLSSKGEPINEIWSVRD